MDEEVWDELEQRGEMVGGKYRDEVEFEGAGSVDAV